MASHSRHLIIKLTAGVESPEKLSQAFTVAATAVASGAPVSLWLTGESTWLAVPGRAEEFSLPHAARLADLRDAVLAAGVSHAVRRVLATLPAISGTRSQLVSASASVLTGGVVVYVVGRLLIA